MPSRADGGTRARPLLPHPLRHGGLDVEGQQRHRLAAGPAQQGQVQLGIVVPHLTPAHLPQQTGLVGATGAVAVEGPLAGRRVAAGVELAQQQHPQLRGIGDQLPAGRQQRTIRSDR